ncbi:MAG TPA: FkbM family methyltransferase [Phycisphaerales bacterium]|nr:FkbM family methyltransferase [Phycisphaerales bacterium]
MKLLPYDAYTSLTRVFDRDESIVVIDVGANEGQTVNRVLKEFPNATIHAFEPAPLPLAQLRRNHAEDPRVHLYGVACGSAQGVAKMHITQNHWCNSLLAPSDLGKRFYGDWYEVRDVIDVPVVTLDAWTVRQGVSRVDVLKIDAQGFDLEVLRGATGLLRQVRAINCECQFAAEYEGCATFSQVDSFLAQHGFALHQLHEVNTRGDEEQTSYGDGLWLRVDVLHQLQNRRDLPDLSPRSRVQRALREAKARGHKVAALYGSGRHTQAIGQFFDEMPLPIRAVLDDDAAAHGSLIAGRKVICPSAAWELGIDVVVLSSDAHERTLWNNSLALQRQGMSVVALYSPELVMQHVRQPVNI